MRLAEWDLDKNLYEAIRTHAKDSALIDLFEKYDSVYDVADALKLNIDSAFVWFRNMNKPISKLTKTQKEK